MTTAEAVIAHLVTAETSAARLDVLAVLAARQDLAAMQRVFQLGPGTLRRPGGIQVVRVHAPLPLGWLGARVLGRELQRRLPLCGHRPVILHAWSPSAAKWCLPLVATDRPLLLDVEPGINIRPLADWSSTGTLAFVCPSETVRRRLLGLGVPPARCVLIRSFVDFAALDRHRRAVVRAQLDLDEHHAVVIALPPIVRRTGPLTAAWAALLLAKVRPDLRLVVPAGGRERQRVRRLVEASRHEWMARFATPDMALPELLAAADLAVYLPAGDAPIAGLAWAMAAGRPIVATAIPAVTELLARGHNAWLCRADDPEDAARRMLRALEEALQSRRQADRASAEAAELFSRPRMIERYRRAYDDLAARRPVGASVTEAVGVVQGLDVAGGTGTAQ